MSDQHTESFVESLITKFLNFYQNFTVNLQISDTTKLKFTELDPYYLGPYYVSLSCLFIALFLIILNYLVSCCCSCCCSNSCSNSNSKFNQSNSNAKNSNTSNFKKSKAGCCHCFCSGCSSSHTNKVHIANLDGYDDQELSKLTYLNDPIENQYETLKKNENSRKLGLENQKYNLHYSNSYGDGGKFGTSGKNFAIFSIFLPENGFSGPASQTQPPGFPRFPNKTRISTYLYTTKSGLNKPNRMSIFKMATLDLRSLILKNSTL